MSVGPSVRCWFRMAFRFQRLAWCSSASRFLLERNEQQIQHRGLQTAHSKGHNCGVEPFRAPRPFCAILVILRKHVKSPAPLGDCSGALMHPRNVARLCASAGAPKCQSACQVCRSSANPFLWSTSTPMLSALVPSFPLPLSTLSLICLRLPRDKF